MTNTHPLGGGTRGDKMDVALSVVIPAFNSASTIRTAVRGALAAGASEVLVVDDGSIDDTASLARDEGARIISQANSGAARARIVGLTEARGEYLVLLDADDQLLPDGIKQAMTTLCDRPELAAVAGGVICAFEDGRRKRLSPWDEISTETLLHQGFSPVPPAAIVWRRQAVVEALVEPPEALWPRFAEDFEMLLRVSLAGKIHSQEAESALYMLSGGKSQRTPVDAALSAINIANHYADLTGSSIRRRPPRSAHAQAHLRVATTDSAGLRAPKNLLVLIKAFAYDPIFILRWFRGGVTRNLGWPPSIPIVERLRRWREGQQ